MPTKDWNDWHKAGGVYVQCLTTAVVESWELLSLIISHSVSTGTLGVTHIGARFRRMNL
jgi:hypothetical protein